MNKIAHTLGGGSGASDFSQKAEVPSVPEGFQVGTSGCPTACHKDFGADGASKGCSYLMS